MNRKTLYAILFIGLVVGALDAVAASLYSYGFAGSTPDKVFRFVASGVFGQRSLNGGMAMAAWGLLFHFLIATGWSALFYVAYPKIDFLRSSKYYAGFGYGVFVWLVMNMIVIPLSNVQSSFHFASRTVVMIMIHMFVIGVPISFLTSNSYSRKREISN
jgi:hypothetical protein